MSALHHAVSFSLGTLSVASVSNSLGAFNIDPESVSVSGLSSGAFFSVQLGVAYSGTFKAGFGSFAGGPYDCARDQIYTDCNGNNDPSIILPTAHMHAWSGHQIDPVVNLESRKIYLQVGSADTVVGPNVMDKLHAQLSEFAPPHHVSLVRLQGAVHTYPTDFDALENSPCDELASPFISNCGYDGAGAVLQWMYGSLLPPNTGSLTGSLQAFAQEGSLGAPGMGHTGYLFVPEACQDGYTACKLHVALHGCAQSFSQIGLNFVGNTGYTRWADTNNIIVLFPQTMADPGNHTIFGGTVADNSVGCWDFIGWYGQNCDQKGGVQMSAVINQVRRIMGDHQPMGPSWPQVPLAYS